MERFPEFVANHLFLFSLLASILMLLAWNIYGDVLSGVKVLVPDDVTRLINREGAQIVDLRTDKEFESGQQDFYPTSFRLGLTNTVVVGTFKYTFGEGDEKHFVKPKEE